MFLNPEELIELTGKQAKCAQKRALENMGIVYRLNALGKPVVLRQHVYEVLSGQVGKKSRKIEPRFDLAQ